MKHSVYEYGVCTASYYITDMPRFETGDVAQFYKGKKNI